MDEKQILWGMYQEHCRQGRHHESQRASATNLLVAVYVVILGLSMLKETLDDGDVPGLLFLVGASIFGALFTLKLHERFRRHMERAAEYRDALEALAPDTNLKTLKRVADVRHEAQAPFSQIGLHWLWCAFHIMVSSLGIFLIWNIVN